MHQLFEKFIEIIGWIKIVLSPLIIGLFIGFVCYVNINSNVGIVLGIVFCILGVIAGILLANNRWKNGGTISFLSRISATPELEKKEEVK